MTRKRGEKEDICLEVKQLQRQNIAWRKKKTATKY